MVEVYELGTVEGEYYIAMEFVDGPDLATLLYRADRADLIVPLPLALYIGSGMCKALDYAHRKEDESGKPMNIVHRDVSPQNILLSNEGAVKLSDFGIARAAGVARSYHTEVGVVLGVEFVNHAVNRHQALGVRRHDLVDRLAKCGEHPAVEKILAQVGVFDTVGSFFQQGLATSEGLARSGSLA